jgi:erythromycin esterase
MTAQDARDVRAAASPLQEENDLDPLLERIGDARYVLLGEASHGTHEYYAWRAALTRRLIEERDFSFVAVEGDWPDCYAVHCSVTEPDGATPAPVQALRGFDRWPTWMWANTDVADFAQWLRDLNAGRPEDRRVGFFGLDVYSLWDSLRATLAYLEEHEPHYVEVALEAFRCFEPFAEDPQAYARSTYFVPSGCAPEVVELLGQLVAGMRPEGDTSRDARFNAEQNALAAAGAEAYYRTMVQGGPESWNVRDRHMAATLDRLMSHHGEASKAVVWEHNTHVGDARWTDMAEAGMVNVGQLLREAHAEDGVVLVGFGSHRGSVVAADRWGGTAQRMTLPAARPGSVEALLHDALPVGEPALFVFGDDPPSWAVRQLDHRAVGVVYDARRERWGNYVPTVLARRYDAFCWFDETSALTPLHSSGATGGEMETWPSGG